LPSFDTTASEFCFTNYVSSAFGASFGGSPPNKNSNSFLSCFLKLCFSYGTGSSFDITFNEEIYNFGLG
jgi:hypothetical protein